MTTTTVTATYLDPAETACSGRVVFQLVAATYHDGLDAIFPTVPITAVLDDDGAISVELEPTSGVSADFDSTDMTYQVRERINGADRSVYYVDIPTASSVDLGTLTTYDDPPGSVRELVTPDLSTLGFVVDEDLDALADTYATLDYAAQTWAVTQAGARLAPGVAEIPVTTAFQATVNPLGAGTDLAYNTALVTKIGAVMEHLTTLGNDYYVNSSNGIGADSAWVLEYETSAVNVSLQFWGRYNSGQARIWTWVDGRPIKADVETFSYTTNGWNYYKLTFPDSRLRRIRLYLNVPFGGIRYTAAATFQATTRAEPKLSIIGDSWSEGSTYTGYPWVPLGNMLGMALNMQTHLAAQGGTGYSNPGDAAQNRNVFGHSNRLADVYSYDPDYVIVSGGINDDAYSAGTVNTAAAALYSALNTNLAGVPVIVLGPESLGTSATKPTAARLANVAAIGDAADAATNVIAYIDATTEEWIRGSGKVTEENGTGTADYLLSSDGVHLSRLGAWWYSQRAAFRVMAALAAEGVDLP